MRHSNPDDSPAINGEQDTMNGHDSGTEEEMDTDAETLEVKEEDVEMSVEEFGEFEESLSTMISDQIMKKQKELQEKIEIERQKVEEGRRLTEEAERDLNSVMELLEKMTGGNNNIDLPEDSVATGEDLTAGSAPSAAVPRIARGRKPKIARRVTEPRSYTPPPPRLGGTSPDDPPVGPIIKPRPSRGCQVWATTGSLTDPWAAASVSHCVVERDMDAKTKQVTYSYKLKVKFGSAREVERTGKQVADVTESPVRLPVGTRVIALYTEEGAGQEGKFFSAVVAETPRERNKYRYLVFFDDQYPLYVKHRDIRLVYSADSDVWNDVPTENDHQEYLRKYLLLYPDKPMLQLKAEDKVRVRLDNKYVTAEINYVDCSLAQVSFSADVCQWVYRGSHRFEPLAKMDDLKIREKLMGEVVPVKISVMEHQDFVEHLCDSDCLKQYKYIAENHRGSNPLRIPVHLGWRREIVSFSDGECKAVLYVAPCGRKCRNIEEVQEYLIITDSNLEIDFFAFDPWLKVMQEFIGNPNFIGIKDLSYNKEAVPIPAVNFFDSNYPKFIKYSTVPIPQKDVHIETDPGFLVCCDCDNKTSRCDDNENCACRRLTISATGNTNSEAGYRHRRLQHQVVTGIYECNKQCSCSTSTCPNRLVQFNLRSRLEVFKTKNRGWGIRARDDLPQGTFICTYAGKLYTDQETQTMDDMYFAELDLIEVAEGYKQEFEEDPDKDEGVESDVENEDKNDVNETSGEVRMLINGDRKMKTDNENGDTEDEAEKEKNSTRKLFGPDERPFVMDANTQGNVGRYFNHSCSPNIFPQNVFVDSHDLRFHTIAFFSMKFVPAGEELCWDYGYQIDTVEGKKIICHCNAENCKGRLY